MEEKVVVWYRFNSEMLATSDMLHAKNIEHVYLSGATEYNDRKAYIDRFAYDKNLNVILIQQKIGQFGLDLSCASTAIYYSNGFSLENRIQTEDRIESPNKHEPLLIIDLLMENSIDEYTLKALKKKKQNANYYISQSIMEEFQKKSRLG